MIIRIIGRNNSEREYNIDSNQVTIGRGSNNAISVNDSKVSRNHLIITRDRKTIRVRDLDSRNGTYINGNRINPQAFYTIRSNSSIKIGRTIINILSSGGQTYGESVQLQRHGGQYGPQPVAKHPIYDARPGQGLGSELEYANHSSKSFVGPAWLTFFLYGVGIWFGGLIANILNLNSALATRRIINRDPPGLGCLWALIGWAIISLALWILLILFILSLAGAISTSLFTLPSYGYY